MSITILRTADAWWVQTPAGAARIDTDATTTAGAARRPGRRSTAAAAAARDTVAGRQPRAGAPR